jgi:hypothetical protein
MIWAWTFLIHLVAENRVTVQALRRRPRRSRESMIELDNDTPAQEQELSSGASGYRDSSASRLMSDEPMCNTAVVA